MRKACLALVLTMASQAHAADEAGWVQIWTKLSGDTGLAESGCSGIGDYERIRQLALRDIDTDVRAAIGSGDFSLQDEAMSFCMPSLRSPIGANCSGYDIPRKPILEFTTCDMRPDRPCNWYQFQLYFAYAAIFNRAMVAAREYPYAGSCEPD